LHNSKPTIKFSLLCPIHPLYKFEDILQKDEPLSCKSVCSIGLYSQLDISQNLILIVMKSEHSIWHMEGVCINPTNESLHNYFLGDNKITKQTS
jgi:hypothetical protein